MFISHMPPHLEDEDLETPEEQAEREAKLPSFGRQGPSKYGKGGARKHKSLGRSKRK